MSGTLRALSSDGYALGLLRKARPTRLALLSMIVLLLVAFIVLAAARWARSSERDVRCDSAKRTEMSAKGKDYSCLLQIPGHDRGH
jgi:hypothetical protein